jgi:hypothetical protein
VRFWFLREEFDRLFPKDVVDWMIANGGNAKQSKARRTTRSRRRPAARARRHPHEPELPAARQRRALARTGRRACAPNPTSNAPQHDRDLGDRQHRPTRDRRHPHPIEHRGDAPVWFSDGGIGSNFPIHSVRRRLPLWPTFAIDLVYPGVDDTTIDRTGASSCPSATHRAGNAPTNASATATPRAPSPASCSASSPPCRTGATSCSHRAPGQRDRIVHIALQGDEGGLNLDMPQAVLERIAAQGTAAGERFNAFSFENHYWIRWRNLASGCSATRDKSRARTIPKLRIPDYAAAYALPETPDAEPPSYPYTDYFQRNEVARLLLQLVHQGEAWATCNPT